MPGREGFKFEVDAFSLTRQAGDEVVPHDPFFQ
jgi:hypothetical protein